MAGQKMYEDGRPKDHIYRLAASLSLEDQIAILAGKDFWRTVSFPEKGIPSIKVTDGPNGARGQFFTNGTPAALFPCGVSLAATWDIDLIRKVGEHLAAETRARGADVLLAPTVCLHRSPLGGRNFESFSEDPHLTGKLAAAYIAGLQSKGVGATIKHFVGNEEETHRMTMDCKIAERPLRELYLKPFEIAIRDANPWALMTAYNLVNGVHADMNMHTLRDILHGEWKYDGLVMSDWTGTNSVAQSIAAGCDLEMPGPTEWRGQRALKAVRNGDLSEKDIERSAANVLYLIERTKGLDGGPEESPERTEDIPERRILIREAGQAGLTLLKNDGLLPLRNEGKTIALIGPNSARSVAHGGGSASLKPYYMTTPLESLQAVSTGPVLHAVGCDTRKFLPLITDAETYSRAGGRGITVEYFKGEQFGDEPAQTVHRHQSDLFLWDSAPEKVLPAYSFKAKCTLFVRKEGRHSFGFMSVGPGRLYVNDELLIDNWDWIEEGETMFGGSVEVVRQMYLTSGKVKIVVESTNEIRPRSKITSDGPKHWYGGCRVGFEEEQTVDLIEEAIRVAREADVAIVCTGLDAEWESEGYDRKTMDLPKSGSQDALIDAVAAANPRTVVVNQSGSPVTMPWAPKVPAILQAWYQGQESGNALADVLFGKANPSGKLPVTFPKALRDTPAYHNWPGENLQVIYGEGIYIGYRHYDRVGLAPLFPFGHGLSYTRFEYGDATLSTDVLQVGGRIAISIPVRNVGQVSGSETVQLYVRDVQASVQRPEKELQAFAKVELAPQQEKIAEMVLDKYAIGFYDTASSKWKAEGGEFEVLIGASSRDISFRVEETFTWIF